ncbi:hypothetical protein C8Q80DRAFT_1268846 [Daedaleopsis nitida]|nr:hypothetical protein C8Q80DRAFT_1268846 [Daedaleopsis nitida]
MKFVTEEELAGHQRATIRGGIEGTLGGLALALPATWYLSRRWPAIRALPIQLKALGVILIVGPTFAIQAERRGMEYDESTWTGAGKAVLDREERATESRWDALTSAQKLKDWAMRNQYKVIFSSWAASMVLAGALVMRNRHQSTPQKVVQARMWAQGLTIGVLIAAGILTQSQRSDSQQTRRVDHSWKNILEEQAREDEEIRSRLGPLPTPGSATAQPAHAHAH